MDYMIGAIAPLDLQATSPASPVTSQVGSGFAQMIERELADVNASTSAAQVALGDLAAGKPVELHEVMITLEKARIGVQTFIQVRNKLVESYQDLMRMQM